MPLPQKDTLEHSIYLLKFPGRCYNRISADSSVEKSVLHMVYPAGRHNTLKSKDIIFTYDSFCKRKLFFFIVRRIYKLKAKRRAIFIHKEHLMKHFRPCHYTGIIACSFIIRNIILLFFPQLFCLKKLSPSK